MISHEIWDNLSPLVILRTCDHEINDIVVTLVVEFDTCS